MPHASGVWVVSFHGARHSVPCGDFSVLFISCLSSRHGNSCDPEHSRVIRPLAPDAFLPNTGDNTSSVKTLSQAG